MRSLCLFLEANDQVMAYETGQESLKTLKRTMDDIGVGNQRINFDPANLLIYDHEDPMDFLKDIGKLVVHVHCKDGCRPTTPGKFGKETRLGDGDTNFAELFRTLYKQGYRGPLTIEREIPPGPELIADTKYAVELIEQLKKEATGQ
jgi:sugar phosphate isomerase/epimerase